jgi:hypothetical protein
MTGSQREQVVPPHPGLERAKDPSQPAVHLGECDTLPSLRSKPAKDPPPTTAVATR